MTTETVPAAQPAVPEPVTSAPVDTSITVASDPVHHDGGKLYEQYLHPSAVQVVKDNGKAPSDLGPLPDHHAVVDTLQSSGSYLLDPTLVPYYDSEDLPEDNFFARIGRFAVSPIKYEAKTVASTPNRGKVAIPIKKPTQPTTINKPTQPTTITNPSTDNPSATTTTSKPQLQPTQAPTFAKHGEAINTVTLADIIPVEVVEVHDEIESNTELISEVELLMINKPVTDTVTSVEDHGIIGLKYRLASRLRLCSYVLMKTFPCEIISVSLDKDVVRVTGVDIIDGQIYRGSWDRNEMVPILNILETKYTLDGINGNTLTLRGADSLTCQIDIHDEDLKAAMASALEEYRIVLVYVINTMGKAKVNTFQVL